MIKVIVTNIYGQEWKPEFATEQEAQAWLNAHIPLLTFGNPKLWKPDYLEGAEQRSILMSEAVEAHEETRPIYDNNMNEIGSEVVMVPAKDADYVTEYLHPAEYTYEIVEESLAVLKARKIAELNSISESSNPYIHGSKFYRTVNIANGKYIKEGNQAKHDLYVNDFLEVSSKLVTELARCTNLVNACTIESEVIGVTFNL